MTILDQIDRVTSGLCPCGAPPAEGSAYCSDDCRPTHISGDTDTREAGHLATPMRWRPDLVTAASDDGFTQRIWPYARHGFTAQVFDRPDGQVHLRLDDGYRFVGCDVTPEEWTRDADRLWRRLERELVNPRHAEPVDGDSWSDELDRRQADLVRALAIPPPLLGLGQQRLDLLSFVGDGILLVGESRFEVTADLTEHENPGSDLIGWHGTLTIRCWPVGGLPITPGVQPRSYLELPGLPRAEVALNEWRREYGQPDTLNIEGCGPAPFRYSRAGTPGELSVGMPSRLVSRALIAPVGTDPSSTGGWVDIGLVTDDGLGAGSPDWDVSGGTSASFRLDNTAARFDPLPTSLPSMLGVPVVIDDTIPAGQATVDRLGETLILRARDRSFTLTEEIQEQLRDHYAECSRRAAAAMAVFDEVFRPVLQQFGEAITSAFAGVSIAAQPVEPAQPDDPMERALQARRNRNTGPAPNRLDGRRRRR